MHFQLKIGTRDFAVDVQEAKPGILRVSVNGNPYDVAVQASAGSFSPRAEAVVAETSSSVGVAPATPVVHQAEPSGGVKGAVLAPIPGLIVEILVRLGETVQAGQTVALMEAMKMENNLTTHLSGVVTEILVGKGSEVATGDTILRIG